jgi:hypothetical protein
MKGVASLLLPLFLVHCASQDVPAPPAYQRTEIRTEESELAGIRIEPPAEASGDEEPMFTEAMAVELVERELRLSPGTRVTEDAIRAYGGGREFSNSYYTAGYFAFVRRGDGIERFEFFPYRLVARQVSDCIASPLLAEIHAAGGVYFATAAEQHCPPAGTMSFRGAGPDSRRLPQ